MNTNLT